MSVIATAVRHLMAAGITGDALLDAIAEMEADLIAAPKPRSAGAIRQERYRERKNTGRLPDKEWYPLVGQIIARDGGKCHYCQTTEKLGADHVLPLSRGGTNDPDNLVACCEGCNKSKGGRTVEEWQSGASPRHGNVTVTECDGCDAPNPLDKKDPHTPKKINPKSPPISPQFADRFVGHWNDCADRSGLTKAIPLSAERKGKLKRRVTEFGESELLQAIDKLAASPFHCGENDRGWKADIGWLLRSSENVTKALELSPARSTGPPKPGDFLDFVTERNRRQAASP